MSYRQEQKNKKHKGQNNRAKDDKADENDHLKDYNNNYKQQLAETEKELTEIKVQLNKARENNNVLKRRVQTLENVIEENKKEYEKQLKEENRKYNSKSKNLEVRVQQLESELSEFRNLNGRNKKEYERQEKVQKLEEEKLKFKNLNGGNKYVKREKQELESKLKNLEEKEKFYSQNLNQLKECYDNLQLAKKNMETDMANNINNLDQHLRDQEKNFKLQFKQANEQYKKRLNDARQKLDEKGNGLRELEEENLKLKEEASKYQSALGVATNIRLGDGDQNHSVKLKQDILRLQVTLENYVTHLKPHMNINIKKVQELARGYGCLNEITAKNPNKLFIKAVLQRKVIDLACDFSREFVTLQQGGNFKLESDIESKARELLNLIKSFSSTRAGTDEVIDASIVKIRQQVYGILGNRGFNNIINNDGNMRTHDFIVYASNKLNNLMNQYREIIDINRREQVNAMAPKLIQDIFKLFWFRTNVQEPKIKIDYFVRDSKIDQNMMKGTWNDDEINKLRVDICYFPLIGRDFDSSDARIYTPAKVFPRDISASNEASKEAYE